MPIMLKEVADAILKGCVPVEPTDKELSDIIDAIDFSDSGDKIERRSEQRPLVSL